MNIETSKFSWWNDFKLKIFDDRGISTRRKIYNTLWAIFFSFLVMGIIFAISGNNPIKVIGDIFRLGFDVNGNKMITYFASYAFAALAVAICFKAGIFNIGISSQMMMSGFVTLVIFRSDLLINSELSAIPILFALFISIISGILISLIAGLLKAYLGINEVVSTIMINWILFYVIKAMIYQFASWNGQDFLLDQNAISNKTSIGYIMPSFFQPQNGFWYSNKWNWIIISLAIVSIATIWFIISKTAFGYKIKMIGLNKDASAYSGTNQKKLTLIVFAISGALAGIAGFIWYVGLGGDIDIKDQPLLAGFDAIAIALLVFNNPLGVLFSSLLYGSISAGAENIASDYVGVPAEINQIIVGVLIYSVAITFIFTKLNLIQWTKKFIILSQYQKYRAARVDYWKLLLSYPFIWMNSKFQILSLKIENHKQWSKIKKTHKQMILDLEEKLKKQHNMNVFDVLKLSDLEQVQYFDKLATFKKETDIELAKNKYFDKNIIIAQTTSRLNDAQKSMSSLKRLILKKHKQDSVLNNNLKEGRK